MAKTRINRPVAAVAEDKIKAAADAVAALDAKYGKGTLMRLGSRVGIKIACIPTGIFPLDWKAIQAGGFPRGRIVEIYGPESSGKTTLLLQAIAQEQKGGGQAALIDAEHAFDPNWAALLGVDVDNLYVAQPDNGEQALEIAETLVRSGGFGIVGVDSVAALVPQAELNGEMGDSHVGLQARLMSQGLRKLTGAVNKTHTSLVFINQIREKVGVMFGSPETTAGGRALKFYASVRIDVRRVGILKEGEKPVGARTKFKLVKNKVGSPFRECEADLMFADGFNVIGAVIEAGLENGAISRSGAWYSFGDSRLGNGVGNATTTLKADPELYESVYAAVLAEEMQTDKAEAA